MKAVRAAAALLERARPAAGEALAALEIQVLAFPALVVLLASASFLAGLSCAAWQWWASAAAALAAPLAFRASGRATAAAGAVFAAGLAALPLAALCSLDWFGGDHTGYHLPAMRLLALGWNPWRCATPEAVAGAFGIEPWDMKLLQVLFMHKGVWVFNAVAYRVHGDALCLTLPAGWFAAAGGLLVALNHTRPWGAGFRLLLAACLWRWGWDPISVVDAIVGIAGFSLLLAMREALAGGRLPAPALLGASFWMVAAKSSGLLACFVFWCVFSACLLVRERRRLRPALARLAGFGGAIALASAAICATPYLSSWRDYGHPLYPFATADAGRAPALDMIADFTATANDDLREAGAVELFCNAYVSPAATRAAHERRTGRPFAPSCRVWRNYAFFSAGRSTPECPTTRRDRVRVWATLVPLALLPGGRFLAAAGLLGLAAAPGYLYGMLRYFRWFGLLLPFAAVAWSERLLGRFRAGRILAGVAAAALILAAVAGTTARMSRAIDRKFDLCTALPDDIYCNPLPPSAIPLRLSYPPEEDAAVEKGMGRHSRMTINNYRLLARMAPAFASLRPHPLEPAETKRYRHCRSFGCYLERKTGKEEPAPRPGLRERAVRLYRGLHGGR